VSSVPGYDLNMSSPEYAASFSEAMSTGALKIIYKYE
jgi:hypothetical protein